MEVEKIVTGRCNLLHGAGFDINDEDFASGSTPAIPPDEPDLSAIRTPRGISTSVQGSDSDSF